MKIKKLQFPARDRFCKKSLATLESFKEFENQFEELKDEYYRFQWYEGVGELIEMKIKLRNIGSDLEELHHKKFG